jgi:hypothetical protein
MMSYDNNKDRDAWKKDIIIIIIIIIISCHKPFLPATSLEPVAIPTAQASIFRLLYFLYYFIKK